jgi:hypothetical protein
VIVGLAFDDDVRVFDYLAIDAGVQIRKQPPSR